MHTLSPNQQHTSREACKRGPLKRKYGMISLFSSYWLHRLPYGACRKIHGYFFSKD